MLPTDLRVRMDLPQVRRLYHWLSYNRFSAVLHGGLFHILYLLALAALIVLAVVFAPYVI